MGNCARCCSSPEPVDPNLRIEGGKELIKHGAMHVIANRGSSRAYDLELGLGSVLSSGKASSVVKAKHVESKMFYACKTIQLSSLKTRDWAQDLEKIKTLDSPHICKLFEAWEEHKHLYLIFEYCRGGDLTAIVRGRPPNEGTISVLVRQMVGAVTHLHQHGIVHGDLKCQDWLFMEPIMATTQVFQMQLKMIDFGFCDKHYPTKERDEHKHHDDKEHAKKKRRHKFLDERLPVCRSPEQLDPGSDAKKIAAVDVWALGVLSFFLIAGQPPFSRQKGSLKDQVRVTALSFQPDETWHRVTKEAKEFVGNCLANEVSKRPSAENLLEAAWMGCAKEVFDEALHIHEQRMGQGRGKGALSILDAPLPSADTILASFKRMHQLGALEKAAMTAAAYHLSGEKMATLRNSFEKFDTNGDGVLSATELMEGLKSSGVSAPELMEILKDVDTDADGVIEYTEFVAATGDFQRSMQEHAVASVFRTFDQDGSGKVSKAEIMSSLGLNHKESLSSTFPDLNLDSALSQLDADGDGQIDAEEFKNLLHVHSKGARRH